MDGRSSEFACCTVSLTTLLMAVALVLVVGAPPPAVAQSPTPSTTVENGSGDVRLQTFYNGGLLAPGTYIDDGTENDSIPAEGAGTRMMWYPEKAALRAGQVGDVLDGTQWNASKVGHHSVAFGHDTKASAPQAVAMGNRAFATARNATAMGATTTASGSFTTAMNLFTVASGMASTAMGYRTRATTDNSLSVGRCNNANTSEDNSLLVVGNGPSALSECDNRSDALVLKEDGDLSISGTLTESSDRRLKTQVEPVGDGTLEKLLGLRPVRFQFKDQRTHPSGEQLGLIAQDVLKEFPALVSEGSDGMLSLAYPKLTAVLLKGLQEQQSTIHEQQAQLAENQAQIDSLKEQIERIDRLEKRLATLEGQSSSSLPAGWGSTTLLILLVVGGCFGAGLLWRRQR